MKARRWAVILGIAVVLCGGYGFLAWNIAPDTLEKRMLARTAALLESVDRGDRLAILRQTVTEQDVLEEMAETSDSIEVSGTIRLPPIGSREQEPELDIHDAWSWTALGDLSARLQSPVSYGAYVDPYYPSISFTFDCRGIQGRCMEHVVFFYTARAKKIDTYVQFWNEPIGRELWKSKYGKGREQKRCDARCPRFNSEEVAVPGRGTSPIARPVAWGRIYLDCAASDEYDDKPI